MNKPNIKFGDILKLSDEWFEKSGNNENHRKYRFMATGSITEEPKGHYIIHVVREGTSYVQTYHCSFLAPGSKERE